MMILKASEYMTEAERIRMTELKAEYAKLTTAPARMREIYAEMTMLRCQAAERLNQAVDDMRYR